MNTIISWLGYAIAIIITSYVLPGIHLDGFLTALLVALVLGIINAFFRPILLLFAIPINIITLGLFTLIIDTLLVMLTASIVPGFVVDGFWWAVLFALILAIVSGLLSGLFDRGNRNPMTA